MGVFDDNKLGQLDWMTQMTETIDSDLNGLLARLPDRTLITIEEIIENGSSSYFSLTIGSVVRRFLNGYKTSEGGYLSWEEDKLISSCFKFEAPDDLILNFKNKTMTGEIYVVKHCNTFSDEQLQPIMGQRGIDKLLGRDFEGGDNPTYDRANEILDILGGCGDSIRNRSFNKKINSIKSRLKQIFVTNEWRIRDMNLANKVGGWIKGYIQNGNLADLTNLCKLKVMTHSNMPIYSVKEEV